MGAITCLACSSRAVQSEEAGTGGVFDSRRLSFVGCGMSSESVRSWGRMGGWGTGARVNSLPVMWLQTKADTHSRVCSSGFRPRLGGHCRQSSSHVLSSMDHRENCMRRARKSMRAWLGRRVSGWCSPWRPAVSRRPAGSMRTRVGAGRPGRSGAGAREKPRERACARSSADRRAWEDSAAAGAGGCAVRMKPRRAGGRQQRGNRLSRSRHRTVRSRRPRVAS